MAKLVFDRLRDFGTVEVRRMDDDGGFALARIGDVDLSVDVYVDPDAGLDRVVLMTRDGGHATVSPGEVEHAVAALGRVE